MQRTSSITAAALTVLVLVLATAAIAYETATHDLITLSAFDQTVLSSGYLNDELALPTATLFTSRGGESFTAADWLRQGSIREDDINFFSFAPLRFRHHFYDPIYDRGLTGNLGGAVTVGRRAFEWALEEPEEISGQDFSWRDGRRSFLTALTAGTARDRDSAMASTFLTLGHVAHLVEDMGVPEHTRNDWHAGVIPPVYPFGTPSLFEKRIDQTLATFELASYASPQFQQLRQFWTTGDGRGLAEFSNRSFVSKDTNFTLAVDGNVGRDNFGNPYPSPQLSLSRRLDLDVASPDAPACALAAGLSGKVTFFGNNANDLVTGDVIRNDFLTTYSVFDSALRSKGQPGIFSVNFCTVEAAAAILLPRATGYAAAVIDYFFRGKLQLDLVPDDVDPSLVRLKGTNASTDTLVDGSLTLYADDPSGNRTAVTPLDSVAVNGVAPNGSITSSRFELPAGAERFAAVYQGTLGNEIKNPDQNVPGGVIGKVLGGVRVEEVFNDGTQWRLRTPKGVFGLTTESGALTVARYEVVKWGDTDSALIARSPLSASPPTVAVFDVPRQPGSSELVIPSGGTDIVLTQRKSVPFPSTVQLTTVNFTQSVAYRQHLARAEGSETYVWVPSPDSSVQGYYSLDSVSVSPFTFEVAYEQTIPFNQSFAAKLDLAHNDRVGTVFEPYFWQLNDVTVDAAGRPLGSVLVFLSRPQVAPVTVPVFAIVTASCAIEQFSTRTITPYFPRQMLLLLWALVDLEQGTVVASTSRPAVTINSQAVDDAIDKSCCTYSNTFYVHTTTLYSGGPQNGTVDSGCLRSRVFSPFDKTIRTVTDVTLPATGDQGLSLDGWLRDDLRQAMEARGRYTIQPGTMPNDFLFVYYCDSSNVCDAMRVHQPEGAVLQYPGTLRRATRTQPIGGSQRVVFLVVSARAPNFSSLGDLLVWDPGVSRAQFAGDGLGLGSHTLGAATDSAALVFSSFVSPSGSGTRLFRLDPTQASTFLASTNLTQAYTLLEPSYLYNTTDLKFHRPQPSLDTTALPATLAPLTNVAAHRAGNYHSIRLVMP